MAHILILYGTTEGQTRRIAGVMSDRIGRRGHSVELVSSMTSVAPGSLDAFDGVIVGASVHGGRHQDAVVQFVKENRDELRRCPSAFYSVSLAVLDEDHRDEADSYVTAFLDETGWSPDRVATFAGALRYTKYGFLKRFIMKQISKRSGRPTDTTRDFEFTDWTLVNAFVDEFMQQVGSSVRQPTPSV